MGNCNCFNKPGQQTPASGSPPTLGEVVDSLKNVSDTTDLNEFVRIIKQLLEEKRSDRASTSTTAIAEENRGMWTSFLTSGAKFLEFVNGHTEKIEDKNDLSSGNSTVFAEIVGLIGQLHWAVGGLSIVAYLIEKIDKVSANKTEALELLGKMVDLATTVIKLRDVVPEEEEKFKKAVMLVVQGSIMCVSQMYSEKFFRFLKTSVNSENLKEMSKTLDHHYQDLNLAISTAIAKQQSKIVKQQSEIAKRQSIVLPVTKPLNPKDAVGIENAREEVIRLLNMTTEDESTVVVVIYGFGGIGKTTLANAVVAKLNLDRYNYVRVYLDEDKSKNDFTKMQQTILKDGFPTFHCEGRIELRDWQDGMDRLKEAFLCPENKPLFLFIDNALRSQDLTQLLPEDLSDLPKGSRIFITTRMLGQTDVFLPLKRRHFAIKPLEKNHALEILCKDPHHRERIKDDMQRIADICGGIPLALKIVRAHLVKMEYDASNCSRILDDLKKGAYVKEENLSQRLVHFVYDELEQSTQDAFLDTCSFLNGEFRRRTENVVGKREVQLLVEAALVTPYLVADMGSLSCGEERLRVHDVVKATGQSMSASTRFRDVESFSEAVQDETKLNGIKGLDFRFSSSEYVVDVRHLNSMRHSLRFLGLGKNVRTSAQSPMKFNELRFLHVDRDIPHVPMKVEELDTLGGYWGPIGLRGMMSMNKLPKTLRAMSTCLPSQIETLPTSGVHNHSLQELWVDGRNIKQFSGGLHQLCSLKILGLVHYTEMEEFPEQVCELSSLIKLSILGWCRIKRLPQSFGGLKGLTHLQIIYCHELEELPSSFGELTALEHLALWDCPQLKELPRGLDSLKYLYVRDCEHLSVESYQNKPGLRIERL